MERLTATPWKNELMVKISSGYFKQCRRRKDSHQDKKKQWNGLSREVECLSMEGFLTRRGMLRAIWFDFSIRLAWSRGRHIPAQEIW